MEKRLLIIVGLLVSLVAKAQLPVLPVALLSSSGIPCTTFGDAIVWVQSSASTVVAGAVTAVQNLSCSNVFVKVNNTINYISNGLGSNSAPYFIVTNENAYLGGTNQLFVTNNFTIMMVVEDIAGGPTQAGWWRGANKANVGATAYLQNQNTLVYADDGAGFYTLGFTDTTHWHVWTFVMNGSSSVIRKDGSVVASGTTLNNSSGFGGGADHTWTILGWSGTGSAAFVNFARGIIWARALSGTELTTYETQCANDYF